jgi:hypothetical protein
VCVSYIKAEGPRGGEVWVASHQDTADGVGTSQLLPLTIFLQFGIPIRIVTKHEEIIVADERPSALEARLWGLPNRCPARRLSCSVLFLRRVHDESSGSKSTTS